MRKILIHIEEIQKKGAKIQFQIKLPRTGIEITGIRITASHIGLVQENEGSNSEYAGWINLRIPEKRDVFYSDLIPFANHVEELLSRMSRLGIGIADQDEWWFGGTKKDFFKINVPLYDTMIEGYFEDHSKNDGQDYQLKVYLEYRIDENACEAQETKVA